VPRNLRALVVTSNSIDADLALGFLREAGIKATICGSVRDLRNEFSEDVGCVALSGDCLVETELPLLYDTIAAQAHWSDIPLILIAPAGAGLSSFVEQTFPNAGNLTILEQPLNPATLVSAIRVAHRARARQLEIRDLLEDRDRALQMRDEFLAMLAHELRNPLAPMRNAVYLQKMLRIDDPLLEKTRDIFDRQVTNLSRMVDDLLDVARLERGKLQLQRQRVDLNAIVAAAVDSSMALAQVRHQRVDVRLTADSLFIDADPVRIEQLITNLLTNAAKFTPEGGDITVSSSREGEMALVSVQDNGAGLSEDMLTRIFNPFIQADRTLARSKGGLGLGLTIAHRLTELHGGTLQAISAGTNQGSTFTVRFPLLKKRWTDLSPRGSSDLPIQKRRVLVVEDNDDIRESLRMILDAWGHDVTVSDTGQKGLELIARMQPEIAFIDIGLPVLDGYQVARSIRASSHPSCAMKLIAITGYGQPDDRERALQAGFDAHMLKPVDPLSLQTILQSA
jgi:signal transduction histidine kinase/CheY-like chemotaxis protein